MNKETTGWYVQEGRRNPGGQEYLVKLKTIRLKDLTPGCGAVQLLGLPYCSGFGNYKTMCKYLASEECGGHRIRKKILAGELPVRGIPDMESRNEITINNIRFTADDIEPLEQATNKYGKRESDPVYYKGISWDRRMAKEALKELRSLPDENRFR